MGYALVPGKPSTIIFADGSELTLPSDRGGQYANIASAYSSSVAERWQRLMHRLDEVWQTLRGLGLEAELRSRRQLNRGVRRSLFGRRMSLADLAASIDHEQLGALIRSVAYRSGSLPEQTPAFAAVELSIMRTFGRWQIQPLDADASLEAGRTSILMEALAARLALRKVHIHLGCPIEKINIDNGQVAGIVTEAGERPAAAVVVSCDPWQAFGEMLPITAGRHTRRQLRSLIPAAAPTITHGQTELPTEFVTETISLTAAGIPTISYVREHAGAGLRTVHDFTRTLPRPSYGVAWNGFSSWLRRPPVTTEIPGLYAASPSSPAGSAPSQVVLSAALAAYGCHDYLSSRT